MLQNHISTWSCKSKKSDFYIVPHMYAHTYTLSRLIELGKYLKKMKISIIKKTKCYIN